MPRFSAVALFARPESRLFDIDLARRMHADGGKLYLYCQRQEDRQYYERQAAGVFEEIIVFDALLEADGATDLDAGEVIAQAGNWEKRTGVTINELMMANRHLGRGFALAGLYHPRSRLSQKTTYLQAVWAYVRSLNFLEAEFRAKGIDLVLNGDRPAALLSRTMQIPFREFALARYRNYYYWGCNEFWETPEIESAYARADLEVAGDLDGQIQAYVVARRMFLGHMTLLGAVRRTAYRIAQQAWWLWRGYQKAKNYFVLDDISLYWRMWLHWRQVRALSRVRLSDLRDRPFVFVPLLTEPERALQGLSPEKFDQLSTIAALARDLPAGVIIAVKENILAVGRRPADFYRQIAEFKNVVLLDPMEVGQDCVRQSAAVALITGSVGFEAAVLGRPVIDLGYHNIYGFLPHVFRVREPEETKRALRAAVFADTDQAAAWKAAGRRFLAALVSISFDMREYDFIGKSGLDPKSGAEGYARLLRSLDAHSNAVS